MMTPSFTILAFMLLVYGSMAATRNPDQEAEVLGKGQVAPRLPTAARKETIIATTTEKIGLAVAGQAALKPLTSMSQMHINPAGELSEVFDPEQEKPAEHKERKMRQQKRQGHLEISPMGEVLKASILLEAIYTLIHQSADCCRSNGALLDNTKNGAVATPRGCQSLCDANPQCKYFSHSTEWSNCALCSKCDFTTTGCCAPLYTSWTKANNLAFKKPATSSGVWTPEGGTPHGEASRVTDGEIGNGSQPCHSACACTTDGSSWVTVDLQSTMVIDSVKLIGRRDCCPLHSKGWTVRVGDQDKGLGNTVKCALDVNAVSDKLVTVPCNKAVGRYVTIESNELIVMCELEAYGSPALDHQWRTNGLLKKSTSKVLGVPLLKRAAQSKALSPFGS